MPMIDKMRINNDPYDLAGANSAVQNYTAGDGIIISEGRISAIPYADESIKAMISAINGRLDEYAAIIVTPDTIYQTVENKLNNQYTTVIQTVDGIVSTAVDNIDENYAKKSEISQTASQIRSEVTAQIANSANDTKTTLRSEFSQTAEQISSTVEALTSEGGVISKATSSFQQTVEGFKWTVTSELNRLTDGAGQIMKQMSFGTDGLKIAATTITGATQSYVKITENGMEIYSQGKKVAEATGQIFKCNNGLGVNDWIIATSTGSLGNKVLNFYRG